MRWLRLLERLLIHRGIRTRCHLLCWRSLLRHATLSRTIALMSRKQARQEARIQLGRVPFIDCYLRRPKCTDEALDDSIDLGFETWGDKPGTFWAQKLQQR